MRVPIDDEDAIPTRRAYDRETGTLTVVCDVLPASVDDVRVRTGPCRVCVEVSTARGTRTRTVAPPPSRRLRTDRRRAVYNNGVVEITVETAPRSAPGRARPAPATRVRSRR